MHKWATIDAIYLAVRNSFQLSILPTWMRAQLFSFYFFLKNNENSTTLPKEESLGNILSSSRGRYPFFGLFFKSFVIFKVHVARTFWATSKAPRHPAHYRLLTTSNRLSSYLVGTYMCVLDISKQIINIKSTCIH